MGLESPSSKLLSKKRSFRKVIETYLIYLIFDLLFSPLGCAVFNRFYSVLNVLTQGDAKDLPLTSSPPQLITLRP